MIEYERRGRIIGKCVAGGSWRGRGANRNRLAGRFPGDAQPDAASVGHAGERIHLLGDAIFGHVEVVGRQISDELPFPVAHDDIDEDRGRRRREGLAIGGLSGGLGSQLRVAEGSQEYRGDGGATLLHVGLPAPSQQLPAGSWEPEAGSFPYSTIRNIVDRNTCSLPCFTTARRP